MEKNYNLAKSCDRKLKQLEKSVESLVETILKKNDKFMANIFLGVKAALTMQGLCFIVLYFIILFLFAFS